MITTTIIAYCSLAAAAAVVFLSLVARKEIKRLKDDPRRVLSEQKGWSKPETRVLKPASLHELRDLEFFRYYPNAQVQKLMRGKDRSRKVLFFEMIPDPEESPEVRPTLLLSDPGWKRPFMTLLTHTAAGRAREYREPVAFSHVSELSHLYRLFCDNPDSTFSLFTPVVDRFLLARQGGLMLEAVDKRLLIAGDIRHAGRRIGEFVDDALLLADMLEAADIKAALKSDAGGPECPVSGTAAS